jgi:hypothetical protein
MDRVLCLVVPPAIAVRAVELLTQVTEAVIHLLMILRSLM